MTTQLERSLPTIMRNEPCDCPAGECRRGVEDADCVNRLSGMVYVTACEMCRNWTWHQEERCLRCAARGSAR